MKKVLSQDAKQDLAFALLLLKDFKTQGRFDPDVITYILKLVDLLGVKKEFDYLLPRISPMLIRPRDIDE